MKMFRLYNNYDETTMIEKYEEEMLERAGLDSRRGQKTYDYTTCSYRFWCGECGEEVKANGECQCGWRTIEFNEVGI